MKRFIVLFAVILGIITWGCTKYETENLDLKDSLERSVADINNAVNYISTTKGFQMLSVNSSALKCDDSYLDSISLDLIAGVYDFKPDMCHYHMFFIPYRLFKKTGESEQMVVNMPHKLAFHPKYLYDINPFDSLLENNFTISASDYHYYYSLLSKYDYKLTAGFTLDSEDIGSLDVTSVGNKESGLSYSSDYTFNEGYKVSVGFHAGDSTVSTFALTQDDEVLMEETMIRVRDGLQEKEKKYILTIGNIDLVKGTGMDSIQVYLDGVLQEEAAAIIMDTTYYGVSIRHTRNILITFDDGTTAKLSELIKPAREALATVVDALHSMNFATNIVNYIAISIYYHNYLLDDFSSTSAGG
ncbi:MAG: hypothetical protein U9N72_07405 [Bacteroidota bacterium]|nr:hypothetical protein [Bacteroidota bacterium]